MPRSTVFRLTIFVGSLALAASPVLAQKQGQGGSVVQGAAGTSGSAGDKGLEHCDKPMAAVAVAEPQSHILSSLSGYGLSSPVPLIRLMIQQSNCFLVVERGVAMQNMMQERQLAQGGEMRQGANMGGGQMVPADFLMTPNVVFAENNAGGVGGAVGGLLGRRAPVAAAVAGGLKFKEAQTSMLLADSRSGVQVAAAEGSTRKADLRLGVGVFGSSAAGGLGGYGNTNEGKIIAAALMDNYNNVVKVVRGDASLQRNVGTLKQEAAAGGTTVKPGAAFNVGDVVVPKIANIKMVAQPTETGKVISTLGRAEELVVIGDAKDGYVNVQGASGSGWVLAVLVQKR